MGMFGYFKIPDVILTLASSQKLNWTHSFDTHSSSLQKIEFAQDLSGRSKVVFLPFSRPIRMIVKICNFYKNQ